MVFGEDILAMHLQVKYQAPIRRFICPVCGYPLEKTDRGLHCKFDGWHESPAPMKYVPRVPETPQS